MSKLQLASYPGRNDFERGAAKQLTDEGLEFDYEPFKLEVSYPPRVGKYTPDFVFQPIKVLVETKGIFFDSAADRQKLILVRDQNPDWEIWLLFEKPGLKIYKGSKTTYEKWAESKGFKYAVGTQLPKTWIAELKARYASLRTRKEGKRCRSKLSSTRSTCTRR
jgi:Phage endonuclease I